MVHPNTPGGKCTDISSVFIALARSAGVRKKMLVEKIDIKDAKTNAYRDYFWGNIDPYRVVVAHGRDVALNPPQKGSTLNTFGYPYAEVGGHPIDFYDPASFVYRITYHKK